MKHQLLTSLVATLVIFPGIDQCPPETDADQDGYSVQNGDCDDTNSSIYPGAPEICDGLDNDCNPSTPEDCSAHPLAYRVRSSALAVVGNDNGRMEPNYYDEQAALTTLDEFNEFFEGQLEYVSSAGQQYSALYEKGIDLIHYAQAGGKDDYGYGQGIANALSLFQVDFSILNATVATFEASLEDQVCNDGGMPFHFVSLVGPAGEIAGLDLPGTLDLTLELEPGDYSLISQVYAGIEMTGGGDAYPCASVKLETWFQVYNL